MTENQIIAATLRARQAGALRRGAGAGYRWLLLLFLVAGVVQIFLAGLGVFHLHAYGLDDPAGDSALDPHRTLGFAMGGHRGAHPGARAGRQAGRPAGRPGRSCSCCRPMFLQSLLAGLGDDSPVWGGLHALDGLLAIGGRRLPVRRRAGPAARRGA